MISRIEAYGYRCFRELGLDLDRFHVLAGANGAGKTTLLDVPPLLGDLLRQQNVAAAFLERRGQNTPPRANSLTELLFKRQGDRIAFAIEARLPAGVTEALVDPGRPHAGPDHLRYEVWLTVTPRILHVADERLFLFSSEVAQRPRVFPKTPESYGEGWEPVILRDMGGTTRFVCETAIPGPDGPPLSVPHSLLALGNVPPDPTMFPAALWLAQLLRQEAVYFDPDWDLLRQPAPPGDGPHLLRSGRNTPWLALRLATGDPDRFASWVDHVRTALSQIRAIDVIEREEDHHAYFSVEYNGGHRVTSSGLSDGTLRILALTLLPYLDDEVMPGLLVVEEPENGIHPRAIETVVDSLGSLYDTQVWISTHSPIVLAHTDLADVLAARLENDGSVSVIPGNEHPRLRDWQGSLDLGTLFAAGVLS